MKEDNIYDKIILNGQFQNQNELKSIGILGNKIIVLEKNELSQMVLNSNNNDDDNKIINANGKPIKAEIKDDLLHLMVDGEKINEKGLELTEESMMLIINKTSNSESSLKIQNKPTKQYICMGAWITIPSTKWTLHHYFTTIRGSENLHIYLWALKDFSWTQDNWVLGMVFGTLALAMSVFLIIQSIRFKNYIEFWHFIAQFLWLFGNFWWMYGELHDYQFPDLDPIYDTNNVECSWILVSALSWLAVYYLIILPFKLFPPITDASYRKFDDFQIKMPKWLIGFPTLRYIENLHIVCWLGKDTAWSLNINSMWIVFMIPTLVLAFIFIIITSFQKHEFVNHMHYVAQFMWVIANIVWAYGELFLVNDDPLSLFDYSEISKDTNRWISAWILFATFLLCAFVYVIWIPLSIMKCTVEQQQNNMKKVHKSEI